MDTVLPTLWCAKCMHTLLRDPTALWETWFCPNPACPDNPANTIVWV